ncbi:MobA/MobL family protein [Hydrogenophaga sp.]|uniref:MobA/MobL family protein n=1 Tax=Hydrogenophaga sp. TaxID=1904254 RepID=UPI0025BF3099|nr:MobA/MobL family protein [Hydrogenophaga sp.]
MATYHLGAKCFSRRKGESATACAAYRAGERIVDVRTGCVHDFSDRDGVALKQLFFPTGTPELSREACWNLAEAAERRKDSTVAREVLVSLPHELPRFQQYMLSARMARWIVDTYGCVVDLAIHTPTESNDHRNFHSHMLTSTRRYGPDGFTGKCREFDDIFLGPKEIRKIREVWCEFINEALAECQLASRVDHRSHAVLGRLEIPTIAEGRGPGSEKRRKRNRIIRSINRRLLKTFTPEVCNQFSRVFEEKGIAWQFDPNLYRPIANTERDLADDDCPQEEIQRWRDIPRG